MIVEERLESWVDTKLIVEKLESSVDAFGQHAGAPSYSLTVPFIRDFIDSQQNKMAERFGTCEGNLLLVKLPTLLIDVPAIRDCPPTIFVSMSLSLGKSLAQFRDPTWSLAGVPV